MADTKWSQYGGVSLWLTQNVLQKTTVIVHLCHNGYICLWPMLIKGVINKYANFQTFKLSVLTAS